nr:MAG TPA: hypothetical protein [Caudoviricetes sp.]
MLVFTSNFVQFFIVHNLFTHCNIFVIFHCCVIYTNSAM